MGTTAELKSQIYRSIEKKNELIQLCSDVIKIPSDNPPGDTIDVADFLRGYLEEREVNVRRARFFRRKGVPSANYGLAGYGMAMANEYVTVDSLVTCTKVNASTVIGFLIS